MVHQQKPLLCWDGGGERVWWLAWMSLLHSRINPFRVRLPSGLTVNSTAPLQATDLATKPWISQNSITVYKGYAVNKIANVAKLCCPQFRRIQKAQVTGFLGKGPPQDSALHPHKTERQRALRTGKSLLWELESCVNLVHFWF